MSRDVQFSSLLTYLMADYTPSPADFIGPQTQLRAARIEEREADRKAHEERQKRLFDEVYWWMKPVEEPQKVPAEMEEKLRKAHEEEEKKARDERFYWTPEGEAWPENESWWDYYQRTKDTKDAAPVWEALSSPL